MNISAGINKGTFVRGRFHAMGSPCEILLDTLDVVLSQKIADRAVSEVRRIEDKFSRYKSGNVVDRINSSSGRPFCADAETSLLLDFAQAGYDLSDGLFDITTGVLRKAWRFEGNESVIGTDCLNSLRPFVGWGKVKWSSPQLEIPSGFEIDLGGICKEYAADRVANLIFTEYGVSLVVNLGGDIVARGHRVWDVGIEDVYRAGHVATTTTLANGALATSGNTKRFTTMGGRQLGHILNPRTGWPVPDTPRSVTVAGSTCTEAGYLSTLSMLHGANAEAFIASQDVKFWAFR